MPPCSDAPASDVARCRSAALRRVLHILDEHRYIQDVPAKPHRLAGRSHISLAAKKKSRRKRGPAPSESSTHPTQVHIPVQDLAASRFWKSGIGSVAN